MTKKRHDHRQSTWCIAAGEMLWCYRCGAIRMNRLGGRWERPTGPNGQNPAMKNGWEKKAW